MNFCSNVLQTSTVYASIDGVEFSIWRHTFKIADNVKLNKANLYWLSSPSY